MSEFDEQDPNAPSKTQLALKRVESLIRKHADCELLLALDGICHLKDQKQIQIQLSALTRRLEQK